MIWRTDTRQAAREAGVAPEDINRHVFWAWRIRAAGGAQAVVYGLGPTRGPRRSGGHG